MRYMRRQETIASGLTTGFDCLDSCKPELKNLND